MKKIILVLIILFPIVSACTSSQNHARYALYSREDIRIFAVNYLEKYEDTLNAMFNYEWTLFAVEEIYVPVEQVRMHHITRSVPTLYYLPEQFTVWTIEYHNSNGDLRRFVFDNRSDFSDQIMRYISNYIVEFYREKFFDCGTIGAIGVSTLEVSSVNFHGMLARLPMFTLRMSGDPAMIELDDTTREYKRLLSTPEGAISLSSLTPINIFEMLPFYLWVSVRLDEYAEFDYQSVEIVVKQIEEIFESINYFTNHRLNARVNISSITHENVEGDIRVRHHRPLYYIRGEKVFNQIEFNFHKCLFESYRGVFW